MDAETIALIRAAQDGETEAFHKLIAKYDGRIMGTALQLLKNKEDAEDIYQEVFIKVWRQIPNFEFRSDFYTWLYRVTANTCFSYRSGKQRHHLENVELQEGYHDSYSETPHESNEMQQQISRAVDRLPQKQRTVFILRFYEGHKIKDIANLLGCTTGTIKRYLHRATGKIRKDLVEYV